MRIGPLSLPPSAVPSTLSSASVTRGAPTPPPPPPDAGVVASTTPNDRATDEKVTPPSARGADNVGTLAPAAAAAAGTEAVRAEAAEGSHGSSGDGFTPPSSSYLELEVVLNPPAVTLLECPIALPMSGFAIVARAELEFGSGMEWEWLRESDKGVEEEVVVAGGQESKASRGGHKGSSTGAAATAAAGGKGKKGAGQTGKKSAAAACGVGEDERGFVRIVGESRWGRCLINFFSLARFGEGNGEEGGGGGGGLYPEKAGRLHVVRLVRQQVFRCRWTRVPYTKSARQTAEILLPIVCRS